MAELCAVKVVKKVVVQNSESVCVCGCLIRAANGGRTWTCIHEIVKIRPCATCVGNVSTKAVVCAFVLHARKQFLNTRHTPQFGESSRLLCEIKGSASQIFYGWMQVVCF